jgi:hypothetical protein
MQAGGLQSVCVKGRSRCYTLQNADDDDDDDDDEEAAADDGCVFCEVYKSLEIFFLSFSLFFSVSMVDSELQLLL